MADDNILEIGATINLASYLPGMNQMVGATETGVTKMAAGFQQLATITLSSTAQMTTAFVSVPAAAQVIPSAVEKVKVTTEESTTQMGNSWRGLAGTIRTAAGEIIGSVGEIGAKMSETAERSRLGVGVMESAFAGLSSLLGAGIAVGFAAHFLDESARVVLELKHLEVETNISIATLSGLRAVAQQTAVPFESIQTALIRMQRAQVLAIEGNTALQKAFADLGVSVDQLRKMSPEELFFTLAQRISATHAPQVAVATAMQIMGRGVYTLIPLLREYGGNLQQLTAEAAKHSGVTDQAAEAAAKWHKMTAELAQTFQSFMIPVLEIVIPVVKAVQTAFEAVATAIVAVIRDMIVTGKLFKDIFTLNWTAFKTDSVEAMTAVGQVFKDGYNEIKNIWSKPIEAGKLEPGDLSDLTPKAGKSDLMQQFREQLDQMRDAQVGFHELSKAEEADFWKAKLDIARGTPALYRQVYHEYVTAEREARKQTLSEEVSQVELRVQSERVGSFERVEILREELSHLREIHAEETSEYKRLQGSLVTAQREMVSSQEREFVQSLSNQLAETKSATEKMTILKRAQLQAELAGFGTGGESFRKIYEEQERAQRQAVEEQRSIDAIDQDAVRAHEQTKLEIRRQSLQTQQSLGLITAEQRINSERKIVDEEINLERQALETKLELYKRDPVEYERVLKQIEALQDKHAKIMAQLDDQQLKQQLEGYKRFETQITSGFSNAVGKMVETGRGFAQAMAQLWNGMVVEFAKFEAQRVAKFIVDHTVMLGLEKLFQNQTLIAHLLGITQKKTADTASKTTEVTQTTTANAAMTASDAAYTTAHVAGAAARTAADVGSVGTVLPTTILTNIGLVTSEAGAAGAAGFASAMIALPFPVNIATAPGVMAASISAVLGNLPLASAMKGAVLQEDTLVSAHAKEMILPPPISTGLQNVINVGGLNVPPALTQDFSQLSNSSSSVSNTVHHHNVNVGSPKIAVTVNGDSGGMGDLHNTVVRTIKSAIRRGQLGASDFA